MHINEIQDILSDSYPVDHYYNKAYRDSEQKYWSHIPGWLETKAKSRCTVSKLRCIDIGGAYGTLAGYSSSLGMATTLYDISDYMPISTRT
jgi:2-polyprenyl-3-methyl-5-hydroxy-6-metoxy-1,4-benzoquinol methylase